MNMNDLVYSMLFFDGGPEGAADVASTSPIRSEPLAGGAMALLGERFEMIDKDGLRAYPSLVSNSGSNDGSVAARLAAEATVAVFLASLAWDVA